MGTRVHAWGKRGLAAVLSAALACSLWGMVPAAYGDERSSVSGVESAGPASPEAPSPAPSAPEATTSGAPAKSATTIGGLATDISRKPKGTLKDTIKVSPAGRRTVQLQLYNGAAKKWKTRATFTTDKNGKVTLKYPADWKKRNTTKWRVVVKASAAAEKAVSKTVRVTTYNRSSVKLKAKSAVIMAADTGQVFYAKAPDTKRQNASTTKMMTALVALERNKLSDPITITAEAAHTDYSHLGNKSIGDTATVKNLLHMALIASDNGAAKALAIHTAGSEKAFTRLMNARAKELGCTRTSFKTSHGLTRKGHGSSARDLAKIARKALKNRTFASIVNKRSYAFATARGTRYSFETTNKLLGKTKGIRGVKTGFTKAAGQCFVGAYKHKGKTYITVVLGSPTSDQRWNDTKALIKYIKKYF